MKLITAPLITLLLFCWGATPTMGQITQIGTYENCFGSTCLPLSKRSSLVSTATNIGRADPKKGPSGTFFLTCNHGHISRSGLFGLNGKLRNESMSNNHYVVLDSGKYKIRKIDTNKTTIIDLSLYFLPDEGLSPSVVKDLQNSSFLVAKQPPVIGSTVRRIGFPATHKSWRKSEGVLIATNRFSVPSISGESGSPILNKKSEVIGVTWGGGNDSSSIVPWGDVVNFIKVNLLRIPRSHQEISRNEETPADHPPLPKAPIKFKRPLPKETFTDALQETKEQLSTLQKELNKLGAKKTIIEVPTEVYDRIKGLENKLSEKDKSSSLPVIPKPKLKTKQAPKKKEGDEMGLLALLGIGGSVGATVAAGITYLTMARRAAKTAKAVKAGVSSFVHRNDDTVQPTESPQQQLPTPAVDCKVEGIIKYLQALEADKHNKKDLDNLIKAAEGIVIRETLAADGVTAEESYWKKGVRLATEGSPLINVLGATEVGRAIEDYVYAKQARDNGTSLNTSRES